MTLIETSSALSPLCWGFLNDSLVFKQDNVTPTINHHNNVQIVIQNLRLNTARQG